MSSNDSECEESATSSSNSESSTSSEDDELVEDVYEKDFLKTLSCLKNKDPKIYDKHVEFFSTEVENKDRKGDRPKKEKSCEKPIYLRDYERNVLTNGSVEDSFESTEKIPPSPLTYNEEQKHLKESFKNVLVDSSEDEECSSLLKKREKGEKEKEKEDADYIQWLQGKKDTLNDKEVETELKPLHDFWNEPSLDEKEGFLKDYILNKRYLERDSLGNYNGSDLSEDEKLIEAQESFEQNYNFRFENEENKSIKRYPRNIEGSLRRKGEGRKKKREEIKNRKKEEKEKKKLEVKRKQKEKLNEIKEKLEKLKEITGNPELGFRDDEIMEDFDPEKYDKRMQELYNDNFYAEGNGEKPDFGDVDFDNENWDLEEINMDCDAATNSHKETRSKKKRKKRKTSAFTDICDIVKPVYDPEKHPTYQKYLDEYYNLDCEDFIDDIPCRFKYREVVANDYGLSVQEILMADDKELNHWVSAKKICKLRPTHVEKNEVKIYRQKAKDEQLKIKLLPSLYQEEEEEQKEKFEKDGSDIVKIEGEETQKTEENSDIKQTKNRKGIVNLNNKKDENVRKKQNYGKWKFGHGSSSDISNNISDSRLLAYNIKPRQFRSKMKRIDSYK